MNAAQRHARWFLSASVVLAAVVVTVLTVAALVAQGESLDPWWLLAVPAIVLTSAAPLYLDRYDDWLAVGTEFCVLVMLSLALDWPQALSLWIIGVVLAQLVPVARAPRAFDASLSIVCGAVAVAVVSILGTGTSGYREVMVVGAAFTLAFLIDIGVSVLRVHAAEPPDPGSIAARGYEVLTLYGLYVGVTAMGYVSVLLYRAVSPWALLAVLPALAIVLMAVKGLTRERETARRLKVLFETANALHSASTEGEVLAVLDAGVRRLGKSAGSGLRSELPAPGDVRRLFISGDDVYWLVIHGTGGPQAATLRRTEALESIAQQAEEALSRMRMNRDLVDSAERDPLTRLSNRAVFLDTVDEALSAEGGRQSCAILFCDLDGFKRVNDQLGHASGDAALVEIARRLVADLPDDVRVARLGGDEFAILVTASASGAVGLRERTMDLAAQVGEIVARPMVLDARTIEIATSIGVSWTDTERVSASELLRNADIAMYVAKREGGGRVVVYRAAMGEERVRSLELVDRLRRAIDERRLRVVYQPIVSADEQRLLAVEALARWTEDGEVVSPEEFIPLAEDANLIEPIGELVLDQVCDDLEQLGHALDPDTAIAINLSARQLDSPRFLARIHRAIGLLAPHPLTLEITETETISEEVIESRVMEDLVERGAILAVDDFGVGFSSLERLMRLPVQVLKLDRVFSRDVDTGEEQAAFLTSMLEMASATNLKTVVEGIERRSQVEAVLSDLSARGRRTLALQGYYFGGPMSPATLVRWSGQRARAASLRRR
ncbi:bifunctional diguanylate cyclase/phosphodiesterase [Mumia sp. zg.B17]|uniref:putative bifunctional diguanylate cyclase/phosphodiesterase n=1 Tax=unclassified Mumia TaxID=2621872 RepID=UPI001C6F1797|nr:MULTISPECIES: bifunctional diguanylate cyclase/phosphodiesterase [unclassified Mumia]MBW9206976.1 bifunctional diguanylate cyclase/phosphodiesterase [Mumia sp. zg.B17]MBW9210692.1 bifunctional diguanylate cyclase/phosphodiesterase [Mumia sp. zg.B21]